VALIPETGTGDDPTANSYITLDYMKAYWTARGYTILADDKMEQHAIEAMDYIESKRASFQGVKTWQGQTVDGIVYPIQPRQFPRTGMQIDCVDFPPDAIPVELMDAQAAGGYEASQANLMPNVAGGLPLIRRKVGPIEREYSDALLQINGGVMTPSFPKLDSLLDALINGCGGAFWRMGRV
jgi:hypothetical protein